MDDYTWRLQLRARKISSYNRTLTMLVIVFFALAVGSVLWYFFIHARSPEYALAEKRRRSTTPKNSSATSTSV